jgi:exosome complex component MTR3
LFPKSTIDVFITILEADGDAACIASGSVAASAALADAGIEMLGLVAACSSCIFAPISDPSQEKRMQEDAPIDEDWGQIWMDPNAEESTRASGVLVMAGMPALGTVTDVRQTGTMSIAQASAVCFVLPSVCFVLWPLIACLCLGLMSRQCLDLCLQQCAEIHTVVSKALLDCARARESKDSGTPKLA